MTTGNNGTDILRTPRIVPFKPDRTPWVLVNVSYLESLISAEQCKKKSLHTGITLTYW